VVQDGGILFAWYTGVHFALEGILIVLGGDGGAVKAPQVGADVKGHGGAVHG
jgi:hypothetical protein